MYSVFKNNRKKVQKAFFETGFWEILDDNVLTLEENGTNATLRKVEITNIPVSKEIEMAYLINLELDIPILANAPNAKTTEKALLLVSESWCYVFMFELKSSLQAEDDNDISAIQKKFRDTISRISVLLTSFIFGDSFKETEIQYKGIVFYNRDNNLISDASADLKRKALYKAFEAKQKNIEIMSDISGKHQVEVFFCKNPEFDAHPNKFSIDFTTFIEESEYDLFALYSNLTLPQVLG